MRIVILNHALVDIRMEKVGHISVRRFIAHAAVISRIVPRDFNNP